MSYFNLALFVIFNFFYCVLMVLAQKEYSSVLLLKEIVQTAKSPFPTLLSEVIKSCESTELPLDQIERIKNNHTVCYRKYITQRPSNHEATFQLLCNTFNSSKNECFTEMRETNLQHRCNDNHTDMFEFTSKVLEYICGRRELTLEQINTTGLVKYFCYDEPRSNNVEVCVRQKTSEKYEDPKSRDLDDSKLPCIDFHIVKECLESYFIQKCSKSETSKFFQDMLNTIDQELCLPMKHDIHDQDNKITKITKATITDKSMTQCPINKDGTQQVDPNLISGKAGDIVVECNPSNSTKISQTPIMTFLILLLFWSRL